MPNFRIIILAMFLPVACWINTLTAGTSCTTSSPNMQTSGNAWTEIPAQDISEEKLQRVFEFLSQLHGRWNGSGESTDCVSGGQHARETDARQILKISISSIGEREVAMTVEIDNFEKKFRTLANFNLIHNVSGLQVIGEGNIELLSLSNKQMRFRTQTVLFTGAHGGDFRQSLEVVREISLLDRGLSISKSEFINGAATTYGSWELTKN